MYLDNIGALPNTMLRSGHPTTGKDRLCMNEVLCASTLYLFCIGGGAGKDFRYLGNF